MLFRLYIQDALEWEFQFEDAEGVHGQVDARAHTHGCEVAAAAVVGDAEHLAFFDAGERV